MERPPRPFRKFFGVRFRFRDSPPSSSIRTASSSDPGSGTPSGSGTSTPPILSTADGRRLTSVQSDVLEDDDDDVFDSGQS